MLRIFAYKGIPVWRHAQVIQWAVQIVSGVLVVALVAWFVTNIGNAIQDRDIPHGFSFLDRESLAPIGQHFLPYEPSDTFLYAFIVGATNTVIVSVVGVVLATALGTFVGVSRLSNNWLVSKAALVYVEFFRNVPLLVQLFFWFYIVLALPPVRNGYAVAERLYLNNAGLSIPWPSLRSLDAALAWLGLAVTAVIGRCGDAPLDGAARGPHRVVARPSFDRCRDHRRHRSRQLAYRRRSIGWSAVHHFVSRTVGHFWSHLGWVHRLGGLMALMVGLVMYTASFIAEIVRAGIQSVGRGQTEAARGLGPLRYEGAGGTSRFRRPCGSSCPR